MVYCSCCGGKYPITKDLSIRKWVCPTCNTTLDRDIVYEIEFGKIVPSCVIGFSFGEIEELDEDMTDDEIIIYTQSAFCSTIFPISETGKTVFLTRADAEKKLKEMEEEELAK